MTYFDEFLHTVEKHPEKIAFVQDEKTLTFHELSQTLHSVAEFIATHSRPEGRVIIALDRGIQAAVASIGCCFAGRCYVPIDLKNPKDRLRFIEQDVMAEIIIGEGPCPQWVSDSNTWIDYSALIAVESNHNRHELKAESLACILYTSGSTGVPKGVAISHRALHHFASWAQTTFAITADDTIASLAPFYFDLSIFDLFTATMSGAQINFIPSSLTLAPARLSSWLAENKISVWYTVPSLLGFLALKGNLSEQPLPHLKTILFAGEVFPTARLQRLTELLPEVSFFNLYGPTETNVCTYWPVDRDSLNPEQPIPIGQAACGAALKIDPINNELMVNSKTLFSGYWKQGNLEPIQIENGHYRTGDKVSIKDAQFQYYGRLDRMLKCSGFRVEPAEIERVIQTIIGVVHCAVIGIDDPVSGQRPAALVVLSPEIALMQIRQQIQQQLPHYMQPVKWKQLDRFPYLTNGKIDYRVLNEQFN